jgi:lysozyme
MSPGETLCKSYEKYARAQKDGTCRAYRPIPTDPPTIGWGSTGQDVTMASWWTRAKADQRFDHSWAACKAGVLRASPILAKYPNRLEAITDFAYNCGVGAYQTSTLRRRVNAARWSDVRAELLKWNHSAGRVVPGLTARRQADWALFQQTGTQSPLQTTVPRNSKDAPPAPLQMPPHSTDNGSSGPPDTESPNLAENDLLEKIRQLESLAVDFFRNQR